MAWYTRKKVDPSVLPEVDKYYSAERRDRAGLAWILAIVSIIVVAAIITALFLAGRFVYNRLTDDEPETIGTTAQNGDAPSFDGSSNGQEGEQTPLPAETGNNDDTEVTPPATTAPATTPRTGDSGLPNTGPSSLVAVFAGVSTTAAAAHYTVTSRRKN